MLKMEVERIGVLSSVAVLGIIVVWFCLSGLDMEVSLGFTVLVFPLVVHVQKKGRTKQRLKFSTKQNAKAFQFFFVVCTLKE